MQLTKTIASIIIATAILMACNSNHSTNASLADAVNNSALSSGSGDDYYYEITMNSTGTGMKMGQITKMFVSSKGDMRSEMEVLTSADGNKPSAPIIIIGPANKPGESIGIDDSAKTYTINHLDSSVLNTDEKITSTATKVGDEKVMGFNCVHARVISKTTTTLGRLYSETDTDTIDLWKSNEVPQQSSVKALMNRMESGEGNSVYSAETADQLKQMGCDGFTVKMVMNSKDVAMILQLTKMERRNIPAGMFEIPAGYKEVKE